jgi:hypothetical protein
MWNYALGTEENHVSACKQLQLKMANFNPNDTWAENMVGGALPNGEGYVFVFVGDCK